MTNARVVTPAQIVGVFALAILAMVLLAIYRFHVARFWRRTFAAGMVAILVFVGIVQAFQKINFLNSLAPTGTEPTFAMMQDAALLLFVTIGIATARRSRSTP